MAIPQPLYLQAKLYQARMDRQLIGDQFPNKGVFGTNDMKPTAATSTRGVDIAAGTCYIAGTQSANQGTYRMISDAALTLNIDPSVTFPRVDQVIARIYDSGETGTLNEARIEILKGVEASGANLTNRTGAVATLPPNSFRICDVLAPVGSAVLTSAEIKDRRTITGHGDRHRSGGPDPIPTEVVSTLPTSPYDGQIIYFQNTAMAADGIVWPMRYREASASPFKWECVGAVPWQDDVADSQNTSSTTYTNLATVGPSVTAPLAGEYIVNIGANISGSGTGGGTMSFAVGSTPASGGDAAGFISGIGGGEQANISVARPVPKTLGAGDVIVAKYAALVSSPTPYFALRFLSLTPVRVG